MSDDRKSSAVNVAEGMLCGLGAAIVLAVWWAFLVWVDDARYALTSFAAAFLWAAFVVVRDRIRRRRPDPSVDPPSRG